jgi:hypothetical protein
MANMLPSLTTVGTLRFSGNPLLRSLTGIGALRTASGVILSVRSASGFQSKPFSLSMHCTVLTLVYLWCCNQQSSRNLTTIPPFAGLTDLTYDLSLSRLGIVTLTGFPLLKAVPNFMQIAVRQFPHVVRYCNQQG